MNHQTRENFARKTGVTVATGSGAAGTREPTTLRNLQHVEHYRDDAGTVGGERLRTLVLPDRIELLEQPR